MPPRQDARHAASATLGRRLAGGEDTYVVQEILQQALFGWVYQARGERSGQDFAIKVLHKDQLARAAARQNGNYELCEEPLAERAFAQEMRGHANVLATHEIFDDAACWYVVSVLARGGDLLEALKKRLGGFEEAEGRYLIRQAVLGLMHLHKRKVALQDMSLENLLLFAKDDGTYLVKVCDPGQAVRFEKEGTRELPAPYKGLVGKSFRPPELYEKKPYLSTKVDSWCLGWSTFYLLTAQSLFTGVDDQDREWVLFREGRIDKLFNEKGVRDRLSRDALDFVTSLMRLKPEDRISVSSALQHKWLLGASRPLLGPKLSEARDARKQRREQGEELRPDSAGRSRVLSPDRSARSGRVRSPPVRLRVRGAPGAPSPDSQRRLAPASASRDLASAPKERAAAKVLPAQTSSGLLRFPAAALEEVRQAGRDRAPGAARTRALSPPSGAPPPPLESLGTPMSPMRSAWARTASPPVRVRPVGRPAVHSPPVGRPVVHSPPPAMRGPVTLSGETYERRARQVLRSPSPGPMLSPRGAHSPSGYPMVWIQPSRDSMGMRSPRAASPGLPPREFDPPAYAFAGVRAQSPSFRLRAPVLQPLVGSNASTSFVW